MREAQKKINSVWAGGRAPGLRAVVHADALKPDPGILLNVVFCLGSWLGHSCYTCLTPADASQAGLGATIPWDTVCVNG